MYETNTILLLGVNAVHDLANRNGGICHAKCMYASFVMAGGIT